MLRDAWWKGERYERGQLVDPAVVRGVELMWAIFSHCGSYDAKCGYKG